LTIRGDWATGVDLDSAGDEGGLRWNLRANQVERVPGILIRPSTVPAMRSATRARVHRWSSVNPTAAGPARRTCSSWSNCGAVSFDAGPLAPFDANAASPPASQASRHARADLADTCSRAATSTDDRPDANSVAVRSPRSRGSSLRRPTQQARFGDGGCATEPHTHVDQNVRVYSVLVVIVVLYGRRAPSMTVQGA